MLKRLAPPFVMLLALTACGGGGSSLPATTHAPANGGSAAAPSAAESVKVSIRIPTTKATANVARRPAYVSSATQSVSIAVNGGAAVTTSLAAGSSACTPPSSAGRTCTLTVSAPVGTDTLSETLYDASGAALSQGQTSFTVTAGTNNVVNLTLGGVPASITLALLNSTPTQGTAAQIGLTVTVSDAGGFGIIGADPYTKADGSAAPITLSDSDTSGATSINKTQLNSPSDAATVTYSGAALSAPAVFSATASGVANVTTATLTPQAPAPGQVFNDYTTFGYDNARDVYNPNSTAFTPASVQNIHLAWQASLDGDYNTQTQPILATGITDSKGVQHSGVLLVGGGGTGNMYGYDATTGALIWTHNLGVEQYTCEGAGAINFGIGGTVAYDSASKSFYVVGNSNTAPNAPGTNALYHMSAASGGVLGSVNFAPSPVGPSELDFSHTSVTLGPNGLAYVGTAATCDISSWRGRVAAIDVHTMTLANTFFTVWNGTSQPWGGGGVWGWGGVSLDASGNVYTGTGNTDDGSPHGSVVAPFVKAPNEYSGNGDAFLKLSADLGTLEDSNHPVPLSAYHSNGDAVDLDINGTPVIFNPIGVGCDTMAAIQGKSGSLYLYDTNHVGAGPVTSFLLAPTAYTDEFIGDPAYSPATGLVYAPVPVGTGTLYPPGMIAITPGCNSAPSVVWHATFGPDSDPGGGDGGPARSVPAVSAGGVVFVGTPCQVDASGGCSGSLTPSTSTSAVRRAKICCAAPGNTIGGAVWAIDATNGDVLNGGKPLFTTPGVIRVPPTIDGNWLFVLDNGGDMYGLTLDSSVPSIASKYRRVDPRSRMRWEPRPVAKPH